MCGRMDSLDSSSDSSKDSWIERFLSLDGNEFICEVDEDYIKDNFNLYGLRDIVPDFKHALKIILDRYDTTASDSDDPDFVNARELYGLIHQRFILTRRGLDKMVSFTRSTTSTVENKPTWLNSKGKRKLMRGKHHHLAGVSSCHRESVEGLP